MGTPQHRESIKAELESILKVATGKDREPFLQALKNIDKEVEQAILEKKKQTYKKQSKS